MQGNWHLESLSFRTGQVKILKKNMVGNTGQPDMGEHLLMPNHQAIKIDAIESKFSLKQQRGTSKKVTWTYRLC